MHPRIFSAAIILIFCLTFMPGGASNTLQAQERNQQQTAGLYIEFGPDPVLNNKFFIDRMARWKAAFLETEKILPESFFLTIKERHGEHWPIGVGFGINSDIWGTGRAFLENYILMNLLPSNEKPDWMTWEALWENDYTDEEMLCVAIHELAHEWDRYPNFRFSIKTSSSFSEFETEDPPTLYGRRDRMEDFADSLAFYVMWPDYMKKNFPARYGVIKGILLKEYDFNYPMPGSVSTLLTKPIPK